MYISFEYASQHGVSRCPAMRHRLSFTRKLTPYMRDVVENKSNADMMEMLRNVIMVTWSPAFTNASVWMLAANVPILSSGSTTYRGLGTANLVANFITWWEYHRLVVTLNDLCYKETKPICHDSRPFRYTPPTDSIWNDIVYLINGISYIFIVVIIRTRNRNIFINVLLVMSSDLCLPP